MINNRQKIRAILKRAFNSPNPSNSFSFNGVFGGSSGIFGGSNRRNPLSSRPGQTPSTQPPTTTPQPPQPTQLPQPPQPPAPVSTPYDASTNINLGGGDPSTTSTTTSGAPIPGSGGAPSTTTSPPAAGNPLSNWLGNDISNVVRGMMLPASGSNRDVGQWFGGPIGRAVAPLAGMAGPLGVPAISWMQQMMQGDTSRWRTLTSGPGREVRSSFRKQATLGTMPGTAMDRMQQSSSWTPAWAKPFFVNPVSSRTRSTTAIDFPDSLASTSRPTTPRPSPVPNRANKPNPPAGSAPRSSPLMGPINPANKPNTEALVNPSLIETATDGATMGGAVGLGVIGGRHLPSLARGAARYGPSVLRGATTVGSRANPAINAALVTGAPIAELAEMAQNPGGVGNSFSNERIRQFDRNTSMDANPDGYLGAFGEAVDSPIRSTYRLGTNMFYDPHTPNGGSWFPVLQDAAYLMGLTNNSSYSR